MTNHKDFFKPEVSHEEVTNEDDIPVLEDIVGEDGPIEHDISEQPLPASDLIVETLLDDQWKQSYNALLVEAQEKISSARMQWSQDKSEASAQELLAKIQLTFEAQIRETIDNSLEQYIEELRETLLQSLHNHITQIPDLLEQKEDDAPEQE